MKKKIVVAVDSFKGSLSSSAVADVVEEYFLTFYPAAVEVVKVPIADGGEGMTEAMIAAIGGSRVECTVTGPLGEPVSAYYCMSPDGLTAVIEMAVAAGLPLVPVARRNPLLTTTYGVGELIADALSRGCTHFLVGIGGSATNDGGMGMLQALGFQFFDASGGALSGCGASLIDVHRIDSSTCHPLLAQSSFSVACDVSNPFSGPQGAAYVFAPQKGATPAMVQALDEGLSHYARVVNRHTGCAIDSLPGAGAAGGLGGAFVAFLNARMQSGIQLILEYLHFRERIRGASLVITGEGRMDRQTLMGKAPFGVLSEARQMGIAVAAIAGRIDDSDALLHAGFTTLVEVSPRTLPLDYVMQPAVAAANIRRALHRITI